MTTPRSEPRRLHGTLLLRAMGWAAAAGLAVGLFVGIRVLQ